MKYMTFNSSCSYCALANLLELFNINFSYEDRTIAIEMGLPYIFTFQEDGGFQAGAMNQGAYFFNLFLHKFGYVFKEKIVLKSLVFDYLCSHPYAMLGIRRNHGKHAVIFLRKEEDTFFFLNPHRKENGEQDVLSFSSKALEEVLDATVMIGHIIQEDNRVEKFDFSSSLDTIVSYQKELDKFCCKRRSKEEIVKVRDRLFRALAVDLISMMELICEEEFVRSLKELQSQILTIFKQEECVPYDWISKDLVHQCLKKYEKIILIYLSKGGL